jgi:hypothetical protein
MAIKNLFEIHHTSASLVDRMKTVPAGNNSVTRQGGDNFCIADWDTTLDYVQNGWSGVASDMSAFGERISIEVANERPGLDALSYGEDGDWVDIDKYLERDYEHTFVSLVEGEPKPIRSLNIVINVSANGMVRASALQMRGAAVAYLCEYFRRVGVNIDLWVCDWSGDVPGGDHGESVNISCLFRIDTNEGFSVNQLAAYVALPDFLRRMSFAISELQTNRRECGGYGRAGDLIRSGKLVPGVPKEISNALGGADAIAKALYFGVPSNEWDDMEYTVEQIVDIIDKFNSQHTFGSR